MPYDKISDLPDSVTNNVPKHAQEIYKEAYNSAWEQSPVPSPQSPKCEIPQSMLSCPPVSPRQKPSSNQNVYVFPPEEGERHDDDIGSQRPP
jgi:hypothetical protein